MAEIQDPRTGIWYNWDLGQSPYNVEMDANLKRLGLMQQLSVISKTLTTPPGAPSDGDSYIVSSVATGLWETHENDIAMWIAADSAWYFLTPAKGWGCYLENSNAPYKFNGTNWFDPIAAQAKRYALIFS